MFALVVETREKERREVITKKAIFDGLMPYESTRYEISRDGRFLGYVSRLHYDRSDHWYAWGWNHQEFTQAKQETCSMRRAIEILEQTTKGR